MTNPMTSAIEKLEGALPEKPQHEGPVTVQSKDLRELIRLAKKS